MIIQNSHLTLNLIVAFFVQLIYKKCNYHIININLHLEF